MNSITLTKNLVIDKKTARAAQRVLYDNGIEADETGIVLQALCAVIFNEELDDIIDWNDKNIPYDESIWEEPNP